MKLKMNKKALITGATSGIGAAYARRLAADYYDLILTGRREAKIQALADELVKEHNIDVRVVIVELSNLEEVEDLVALAGESNLDILINNAGFSTKRFFYQEPLALQEQMVAVHILAAMKLIYAVLPGMIERGGGDIINVSSAGAWLVSPNSATYCGTKAFLVAMTEALHYELTGTGVRVQVACPGLTRTDIPIRLGIPEENLVDRGVMRWILPQTVVKTSMRDLKKGRVVSIPGRLTRLQVFMRALMPRSLYYKMAYDNYVKYGWIDKDNLPAA